MASIISTVGCQEGKLPSPRNRLVHSQQTFLVNVVADFTSIVEMHKPLDEHDGCEIRRYIHEVIL